MIDDEKNDEIVYAIFNLILNLFLNSAGFCKSVIFLLINYFLNFTFIYL